MDCVEVEEIIKKSLDDMLKIAYTMHINGTVFVEVNCLNGVPGNVIRGWRDTERLSKKTT